MTPTDDICVGELLIRPREHVVLVQGSELELTSREFEILMRLAEHPGWVFSAGQLCDEAETAEYSQESVSVHVSRLRHKLRVAGASNVVETVRGFGYRLRRDDPEAGVVAPRLETARQALRYAVWQLHAAALEAEHTGSEAQITSSTEALDEARHAVYRILSG